MTTRYTTLPGLKPAAPRASYYDSAVDDYIHMPDSVTIFEQDNAPVYSGLLNASGEALYKVEEKVKLGFHIR
jgi:hypothetical protein